MREVKECPKCSKVKNKYGEERIILRETEIKTLGAGRIEGIGEPVIESCMDCGYGFILTSLP